MRGRTRAHRVYLDSRAATEDRVDDLLARMTLAEKVSQLGSVWSFALIEDGDFSHERASIVAQFGVGQITRVGGATDFDGAAAARFANAIQRYLVEETRLGIPAVIHEEICSGLTVRGSTIFPQAIGVASTWEPDLCGALGDAIRLQMRAVGVHQGLSPVLDVSRDPRWGRTEETFGEDPYLVSRMGVAFVRGLQGTQLSDGVVATVKHFVGYGASEGGLNWAPTHVGPREMRDVYLYPFEASVIVSAVHSVMSAYNEVDGVACSASHWLLTDVLRGEWRFEGCVVSDYFAIRQLETYHRLAGDAAEAAAMALTAGIDVELPSTDCYGQPLLDALERGLISEADVDQAVRRVLRTKFALGLFERPYVDVAIASRASNTEEQRELAGLIARKSLVLLKNDGTLPLNKAARVAVIGPNGDDVRNLLGDYSYPSQVESLAEIAHGDNVFSIPLPDNLDFQPALPLTNTVVTALHARLGQRVEFARGCDVNSGSRDGFAEAVALAARSDVIVLVMGDQAGLTDACTSGESRDRASLELPGVQEDLARAVLSAGRKPTVLVLVAGRPCGSEWLHGQCSAVLMAWLPGQEGAQAIADILTGALSPGGKLPITFPRSVGQVPTYYAHKNSGGRSQWKVDYVDSRVEPLYPFGHGLSYSTFELSDASVDTQTVAQGEAILARVTVHNTGDRTGDEVVQLYVRDTLASVTRPVLELKGFIRVTIPPGESRLVRFSMPVGQLGFHDDSLSYVVEPGTFEIFVGTSSVDLVHAGSATVVAQPGNSQPARAFNGAVSSS